MSDIAYRLDDSVIARVAQILQEAILTGTDIVDHLRALQLCPNSSGHLIMSENYKASVDREHERMLSSMDARRRVLNESDNGKNT